LYAHVPHWSSKEAEGRLARDPSEYVLFLFPLISHPLYHPFLPFSSFLSARAETGRVRTELTIRPTIPIRLQHRIRYSLQFIPKLNPIQLPRFNKGDDPQKSRFSRFRYERYSGFQQRFGRCKTSERGCFEVCRGSFYKY
jgi:hypothetical protein